MGSSGVLVKKKKKNSIMELQNSLGVQNISESIVVIQNIVAAIGNKLIPGHFLT